MSQLDVYRALPSIEQDWQGLFESSRGALVASESWYTSRLIGIDGPICELACGNGRLLLPLARKGHTVHGCDAVAERVLTARRIFAHYNLRDYSFEVRTLPEVPQGLQFSAVVLACNALGYLIDDDQKAELFYNVRRILRPDGLFFLDYKRGSSFLRLVRRWPGLKGNLTSNNALLKSSLHWCRRRKSIIERFVLLSKSGDTLQTFEDCFRFTSVRKTLRMLRDAQFTIKDTHGAFSGSRLYPWSHRLIVTARVDAD